MKKNDDQVLRHELLWLLCGGNAHVDFTTAIAHVPEEFYGKTVKGTPYTLWRVLQHMKISQHDILEYIKNPDYKELVWPDDYWPKQKAPPHVASWEIAVKQVLSDLEEIKKIVKNPKTVLTASIPNVKNGPSILREILLVIDHNSYHIGQIILLRGLLGIWED
jgi:uncharacterized damage-inducible protein DinB